jgi:hypothetical protein
MNDSERILVELNLSRLERRRRALGRALEQAMYLLATICWLLYFASAVFVLARW